MRPLRYVKVLPHAVVLPAVVFGLVWLTIATVVLVADPPDPRGLLSATQAQEIEQALADRRTDDIKDILDYRLADYRANLAHFEANLSLQALLVLVTVLLLVRRSETLKLFNNDVPLKWLHAFVPMLLLYYWLRFGFFLDELIESRIRGVALAVKIYPDQLAKSLFVDASFIDGWIMSFVDRGDLDVSGLDPSFSLGTAIFLIVILGSLAAANHACVLALVSAGTRRYLDTQSPGWIRLYYLLPLAPLALILASHLQFYAGGHNPNLLQLCVAIVAVPLFFLLQSIGIQTDRASLPESLDGLKRQRVVVQPQRSVPTELRPRTSRDTTYISLLGDSLSTSFHVGRVPEMLLRMQRAWQPSWFLSKREHPGLESIDRKLAAATTVVARQHATSTAKIDRTRRSLQDRLTGTRHFSDQVDEVLLGRFPDIVLLWIGHNNINWRELPGDPLSRQASRFADAYERQLLRLVDGAVAARRSCAIVVFGLVNFEAFFQARRGAEDRRSADSKLYPFLETGYAYFESMQQEFRDQMVELALLCNEGLCSLCSRLRPLLEGTPVDLIYSEALSVVDIGDHALLSPVDGWHPNLAGHAQLAQAALAPVLDVFDRLRPEARPRDTASPQP